MNQINNSKKIYHAAIYVRLSKEDGDVATAGKRESNSISNQKNLIKNFLKDKKDIVVVSERVDDGYSGSNFERPAFQMMLEDIKKGIVDCVVVKDLSRFGREYIDAGKYIERLFPALGVRFIAVNDHYDSLEGKSQADEIVIPFKNLINDAYCRDISIKIRSHLEVKRKNGEYIGAFTPYGYQKDSDNKNKLVIDVYAADIVKEIYRMKLSGMSQTAIANALNKQGVLSPMEYKHSLGIRIQDNFKTHEQAEWSAMSVKRILENEVYTGTLVQGKRTTPNHKVKKLMKKPETDWVRIEKNHEAIVSEREFALVQRLLGIDTRTSPNEEKVYPLSGLVVCGDCGAMMIKRDVPAGGKVYAYACWTAMVLDFLPYKVPKEPRRKIGWIRYITFAASLIFVAALFLAHVGSLERIMFWAFIIGNILYYTAGIILAFFFKDNRAFCKYICPITVFLKPMSYFSLIRLKCDKEKCVSCGKCKRVCPMNVDVTDNSRKRKNGTECILCMECVKNCPKDAL